MALAAALLLTGSPASVSVVDREEIDSRPAITSLDYVEGMAGVDVITAGLQGGYPVSRGFNEVFSGGLKYRFVDGFPAASGVFVGEVQDYDVVDLNLSYDIPGFRDLTLQLDVQNLFDEDYATFPGAPQMGRLTMARARYTF